MFEHGDEFLNLSKEQLICLISSDQIRVSEEQVFEAVLRWIRHDPDGQGQSDRGSPREAAEVCSHVRFGLLPRDYLVRLSQSDEFLRVHPWCKDFLLEAMGFLLLPWEHRKKTTSERMRPRTLGSPKVLVKSLFGQPTFTLFPRRHTSLRPRWCWALNSPSALMVELSVLAIKCI